MAQQYSSYTKPPGPQNPSKYPMTGNNYAIYGEQNGYVYNPWTDRYDPDPKQVQQYRESTGQAQPKPKESGTSDLILPLAVVGGTGIVMNEVGKGAGEGLGNAIWGTKDAATGQRVGGMFGSSSQPAQPAAPAAAAAPAASPAAPMAGGTPPIANSGGMFGPQNGTANVGAGSAPRLPAGDAQIIPAGTEPPPGLVKVGTSESGDIAVPKENIGSDGTVNFGNVAQGALGAYQLYQGYKAYQEGDYVGAGINTAAGAAGVGAALGSSTAASALPIAGGAAGLYGAYQTNKAIGSMPAGSDRDRAGVQGGAAAGAAIGGSIGAMFGGIGAVPGMAIGAAAGALAGLADSKFGSSKDKYQMIRDKGREYLQQNGVLDQNYQGTLADGSRYDFGKDGKEHGKLNTNNPLWGQAAALGNALATAEGLYGRSREAMATLYANGAMSNAKDENALLANFQHFAAQRKLDPNAVQAQYDKMLKEKQITQEEYNVVSADKNKFMGGGAPAPQSSRMQPLPPGVTPQQVANAAVGGIGNDPGYQKPLPPPRSSTSSPGIGLDGRPIPQQSRPSGMMKRKPPLPL